LHEEYKKATRIYRQNSDITPNKSLGTELLSWLKIIGDNLESQTAVMNVLITSLVEKCAHPSQDVRYHQAKMEGGYSGRTLDTIIITPFLKSKQLKTMKEAGWLTRSLEQDAPYDLEYPGAIRNKKVKAAFLNIMDKIQKEPDLCRHCLSYLLQRLIEHREADNLKVELQDNPDAWIIEDIINKLKRFFSEAKGSGRSKLPVIAFYAIYEVLVNELHRYEDKELVDLGSHTSADIRSKAIGDIQVNTKDGNPFEGVEIKYGVEITEYIIRDSFKKIRELPVKRYYLLSTNNPTLEQRNKFSKILLNIRVNHGCQFIINGLFPTLKYYLRLIEDTNSFIKYFGEDLFSDDEVCLDIKQLWKSITSSKHEKLF
jgi:DNA (cytosine-5)-methyltransferase 1